MQTFRESLTTGRDYDRFMGKSISLPRNETNYAKRIGILRNLLEYLNRARNDPEMYSVKEITQGIEEEYMNVLDKIREEGKLE